MLLIFIKIIMFVKEKKVILKVKILFFKKWLFGEYYFRFIFVYLY